MTSRVSLLLLIPLAVAACGPAPARAPAPLRAPPLTVATSPRAPRVDRDFVRRLAATKNFTLGTPTLATPTPDGKAVLFLRSGPRDRRQSLFELDVERGETRELASPEAVMKGPETLSVAERARRERMRVTTTGFSAFELSRDGARVLVSLSGRLFVITRATGAARELPTGAGAALDPHFSPDGRRVAYVRGTDVYTVPVDGGAESAVTKGGSASVTHGIAEFIAQEELERYRGFFWSPDGAQIVYEEADTSKVDLVSVADVAHPEREVERSPYPRPGRPNAEVRFGLVAASGGPTTWIGWDRARFPYVATVRWDDHGQLTLHVLDRLQKDAMLLLVDRKTGETRPLLREHDEAWLDVDPTVPRFLADGRFLWSSDRGGDAALELHGPAGDLVWSAGRGYTSLFDVDEASARAVIGVSLEPTRTGILEVDLSTGKADAPAGAAADVSARFGGGQHDLRVVKEATPTSLPRHRARSRDGRVDTAVPSVAEDPGPIPPAEIVKAGPDEIRVAIVRPRSFDRARRYPVIDAAYGGPHHNVATSSPYLRDQWIADATDAIVVAIDAPGTERRGRAWSRAILGKLGDVPLAGHVAALEALGRDHPEMDTSRVGVYGWSFGGYFAALAVLARPDVYKVAVAGAPVTDWRDYDTCYTERYLGLPDARKGDYDAASLLVRATARATTPRPLLFIHGTADDNVHFTHTLKLVDVMERSSRPFELMPLVGVTHLPYDPDLAEALWTRVAGFLSANL